MDYRELIKFSENYLQYQNGETSNFTFSVIPRRTIVDSAKNTIYSEGDLAVVEINRFHGEKSKVQIYRAVGRHVTGNSQKAYDSLDSLFEDFDIQQAEYIAAKKKKQV